jgi:F-type H+-transporting ATPase subunit delta
LIRISHIAVPYSKALFDLAAETNKLEEIVKDIELVEGVCRANHDLIMMLKSPVINTSRKLAVLRAIFEKKVSKLTMSFLIIIAQKKREAVIPDIAKSFLVFYKDYKGLQPVYIKSATPVTDAVRTQVKAIIKNFTGKEVELTGDVDEALIGGFVLQWDDKQYDASILKQIKEMKRSLSGKGS